MAVSASPKGPNAGKPTEYAVIDILAPEGMSWYWGGLPQFFSSKKSSKDHYLKLERQHSSKKLLKQKKSQKLNNLQSMLKETQKKTLQLF